MTAHMDGTRRRKRAGQMWDGSEQWQAAAPGTCFVDGIVPEQFDILAERPIDDDLPNDQFAREAMARFRALQELFECDSSPGGWRKLAISLVAHYVPALQTKGRSNQKKTEWFGDALWTYARMQSVLLELAISRHPQLPWDTTVRGPTEKEMEQLIAGAGKELIEMAAVQIISEARKQMPNSKLANKAPASLTTQFYRWRNTPPPPPKALYRGRKRIETCLYRRTALEATSLRDMTVKGRESDEQSGSHR